MNPTPSPQRPNHARYDVIAPIGRGGMAEVSLALMAVGGGVRRLAVLKRIWPDMAADPEFAAMFLDEARLSLSLNHPNIVRTYEVLSDRAELAIVLEYLDGQPLTRVLSRLRGPADLSLPLKLRILTQVLAGLEHAHTLADFDGAPLAVVHRDVSPQNVFVTYDGQIKLVDFGVAKSLAASHHTRPGAIKGKLAYMAPEQLRSGRSDRRADLFSVGVMLWEILANRRLWQRMTEVDIVGHLAAWRPLPPLPDDGSVPAGLDLICARALALDPEQRYQSAADFEADLEEALAGITDSHARGLGRIVSHAFAAERAERQALIERHLGRDGTRTGVSARPRSTPTSAPVVPEHPDATLFGIESPAPRAADSAQAAPRGAWLRTAFGVAALGGIVALMLHNGSTRHLRETAAASMPAPAAPPEPARAGGIAPVSAPTPPLAPAAAPSAPTPAPKHHHRIPQLTIGTPALEPVEGPAPPPPAATPEDPFGQPLPRWPVRPVRPIIVDNPFTQ